MICLPRLLLMKRETPVIVVSVLSADRCEDLIEMDGRTFFLRKPFRREDLLEVVRKALPNERLEA